MGATRQLTQPRSVKSKVRNGSLSKLPRPGKACTWRTLLITHDGESSQEWYQD